MHIDESAWPIVVVTLDREISQPDWDSYLGVVEAALEKQIPFALVTDTSAGGAPDAQQRQQLIRFFSAHEADLVKYMAGAANVVHSPIVRGAMTALTWLWKGPAPFPYGFEKDVEAAKRAAEGFLRAHGRKQAK